MFEIVRSNPKSFIIAVLVHAVLFALLSFNLDWTQTTHITPPQMEIVQAVMVDDAKLKVERERKRKAEERQRQEEETQQLQREEALKREQEAEQRRVEEAQREVEVKRAAEVRQKREAEEKRVAADAERKRKADAEKQHKVEEARQRQAESDKKRKQDDERKAADERKRQEAEERRQLEAQRRQEEFEAENARMQSARQRELDDKKNHYLFMIQQRVESKWLKPSGWQKGTSCKVQVRLVPGAGNAQVIDVRIIKSSGQPLFDRSVESAVFSASPLPFPVEPELMDQFRVITFDFKPED